MPENELSDATLDYFRSRHLALSDGVDALLPDVPHTGPPDLIAVRHGDWRTMLGNDQLRSSPPAAQRDSYLWPEFLRRKGSLQ
jgi:hypothetical protein